MYRGEVLSGMQVFLTVLYVTGVRLCFSIVNGNVWLWASFLVLGSHLVVIFAVMTLSIGVLSWNLRGLKSKFKRALVLKYLQSHRLQIVFLQETHLMGNKILAIRHPWIQ